MSKLTTRVTKLEARTGGGDQFTGPIIYREGESQAETLARYGLSPEAIEGPGLTIWIPETEGVNYEQAISAS